MTITATLLDHAIAYAAAGLEVFPANPATKAPLTRHGMKDATSDPHQVTTWWTRRPDALIAHRLSPGVLITDIDPKHGGGATWKALRATFGERPETRRHLSGRGDGGGHVWWKHPGGQLTVARLNAWAAEHGTGETMPSGHHVAGIDLLHRDHRYTILPPSPHPDSGLPYEWATDQSCELAAMPAWLVDLLRPELVEVQAAPPTPSDDSDSIADWFTSSTTWAQLLTRHSWRVRAGDGETDGSTWLHPRATSDRSATIRHSQLFVYTPNTPFTETTDGDPHGYTRFRAFAVLEHAGDLAAAGRAARALKDGPRPAVEPWNPHDLAVIANGHQALKLDDPGAPILPDTFWAARPLLTHIRQAAWNRIRSPDVVLHAVLARLAAYTPHTYEIPPIEGAVGSLNYFAAAIGPSGAGKSSGVALAAELLPRPPGLDIADNQPLGSGEGIAELYMGTEEEEDDKGKKIRVRKQVRHNAFVYGDEGAALTAMMERTGATLPGALRTAWTGGDLGQANANADRTRVIHAGQYRLGVLLGFQPELAGKLLADHHAGTPQRFTWAHAIDPGIPDVLPDWPGPLTIPAISPLDRNTHEHRGAYTRVRLGVHPDIATALRQRAAQRNRGQLTIDQLDSHEPLHRLKIAGLLAIADGRLDINHDDWHLADTIWTTSCRVRATVTAAVAAEQERAETAGIERNARRELAAQAARNSATARTERLAARLARFVHDGAERPDDGWPRYQLTRRLKGTERHLFDAAASHAIALQWIEETADRYLPGPARPA